MNDTKREELKTKLNVIGYDLINIGCDHWRIINHHKEETAFIYYNDSITTSNKSIFGIKASEYGDSGRVHFDLNDPTCEIVLLPFNLSGYKDCLSIGTPDCFINFYSHVNKEES